MDEQFLENFMKAARQITKAERSMVVDIDLDVLATANLEASVLESPQFANFANAVLRQAVESNGIVITNNIITDPSDAPDTNTNFSDLRVIVTLPLEGHGALYLDQHIRHGIIPRDVIERLVCLVKEVFPNDGAHNADARVPSETELIELYEKTCAS
ncbi:MAG: hypothetical protein SF029_12945 [bacterium]|nr:hypothetical protein [bacterium]